MFSYYVYDDSTTTARVPATTKSAPLSVLVPVAFSFVGGGGAMEPASQDGVCGERVGEKDG